MRHILTVPVIFFLSACNTTPHLASLNSDSEKMSYAIGHVTGKMFQGRIQEQELDNDQFFEALRLTAEMNEYELRMTEEEISKYSKMHEERLVSIQDEKRAVESVQNLKAGLVYREQNAASSNVKVLENGLQYEVLTSNEKGAHPGREDTIVAHYRGTFIDGTEFDSSIEKGIPATFTIDRMIPGWQAVLPLMRNGEKWRIVLPPALAYGENGRGQIGPNQTLIFEIDLLDIKN